MSQAENDDTESLRSARSVNDARTPLLTASSWRPTVHRNCPTCKGKGKLPKDAMNDKELIALIPVGDKRLKPRRTKLIVSITVFLTALVLGFVVFFLYPRTVSISVVSGSSANMSVTCAATNEYKISYFNMTIYWKLHLKNDNYIPVHLKKGHMILKSISGLSTMGNNTISFDVLPHRHSGDIILITNASVTNNVDVCRIKRSCLNHPVEQQNIFVVEFMLNVTADIAGFKEPVIVDTIVPVVCPIHQAPIKPASTQPATTTTPAITTTSPNQTTTGTAITTTLTASSSSFWGKTGDDPQTASCTGPESESCR